MNHYENSVAVLGSGSWATALTKILCEQKTTQVHWWIRKTAQKDYIQQYQRNPNYLRDVVIPTQQVVLETDIKSVLKAASVVIIAIPAAFVIEALKPLEIKDWQNKIVVSATKGIIPSTQQLITDYLNTQFEVDIENCCAIGGPCHAEEIALEKQSFLTIAGLNVNYTTAFSDLLRCRYVSVSQTTDLQGVEYAAILKNIIAIGAGMCHALGYGDNFQAVLVANALQEIESFLQKIYPLQQRHICASVYAGDLLVTAYSQFSRNRTFGAMIGRGYSVQSAQLEMNMIAEGYYATAGMYAIAQQYQIEMPILQTVYQVLYEKVPANFAVKKLVEKMQ